MVQPTWEERELPILSAAVEGLDAGARYVEASEIARQTGLSDQQVQLGLKALADEYPPYITINDASTMAGQFIHSVKAVSGSARRAVGTWPSPEGRAAEIIAALQAVAERAPDEDTRSRLRKVAGYLSSAGRDLLIEVAATAATKAAGLS